MNFPACIDAIVKAAGRALDDTEIEAIYKRIEDQVAALRREAMTKGEAAQLGTPALIREAAERAAKEAANEARLKKIRIALTITAKARIEGYSATAVGGRLDALDRLVAFTPDGKSTAISADTKAIAITARAVSRLETLLDASAPKWLGLFENNEGVRDFTRALFGEKVDNADAMKAAKAWHQITEELRQEFNRNGGDIGKLEDWALPQHHNSLKIAKTGRAKWVNDILPLLNRDKYINIDGSRMSDEQVRGLLEGAWTSIATNGANKKEPGKFTGDGMRANRGSAERAIHFKDADAYLDYQAKYGEKSVFEVMIGHLKNLSRDIAMVETFGPNPDHMYRYFRDTAVKAAKLADPTQIGKLDKAAVQLDTLYDMVAGKRQPVASAKLARAADALRSWLVATRLGSAIITSFSDESTMHMTAAMNGLSYAQVWRNQLAALNPANKVELARARRAGLALDTFIGELNRFGQESMNGFSSKMANAVMRASGLQAWTDARRRAFGTTMMSEIGDLTRRKALHEVDATDSRMLKSKGITDTDWKIWQKAELEDWDAGNDTMLTPDAIGRVSDADIDSVIAPQHAELRQAADRQMAEIENKIRTEEGWQTGRVAKLQERISGWRKTLDEYQQTRTGKLNKLDDYTSAKADALAARVAQAEVNQTLLDGDMLAYIRMENGLQQVFPDRTTVRGRREAGSAEQVFADRLDALFEKYGVPRGTLANRLRDVRESAARQVARAEQYLKDQQTVVRREVKGKTKDIAARVDTAYADVTEFIARSQGRIDNLINAMNRIDAGVARGMADLRAQARTDAIIRLIGAVSEEVDMAVVTPGIRERAAMQAWIGNPMRGTIGGELLRSVLQFKTFGIAMTMRHAERALAQGKGGATAYLAQLIASTTIAGALSMQVNELLNGRDPRNMDPFGDGGARFWVAALLKGGSLGLYGDFLFSQNTQYGSTPLGALEGPTIGFIENLIQGTQGNLVEFLQDKNTNAGAELTQILRGMTPGSSLWYLKAALDHTIFHNIQEYFSPGYLSRMKQRAQREFGQHYWWEPRVRKWWSDPGQLAPERAPDAGAAWR